MKTDSVAIGFRFLDKKKEIIVKYDEIASLEVNHCKDNKDKKYCHIKIYFCNGEKQEIRCIPKVYKLFVNAFGKGAEKV